VIDKEREARYARIVFLKLLKSNCGMSVFNRALNALDKIDKETVAEERAESLYLMKRLGLGMEDFGNMMESRLSKLWELKRPP